MYTITFKNERCTKHGLIPVRRPDIPAPKKRNESIIIHGSDGVLMETDGTYEPITIPVEFNFIGDEMENGAIFRLAKKWLKGSGILEMSDDPDFVYKVIYCDITDTERTSWRIKKFTAEFICDPYMYFKSGMLERDYIEAQYNPGEICHPVYKIKGNGYCTITVNGKSVKATIGQNLTIDTDTMIAYREDGTIQNTQITGDYESLYLQEGDNKIRVSGLFDVKIVPNWRCL